MVLRASVDVNGELSAVVAPDLRISRGPTRDRPLAVLAPGLLEWRK